MAAEMSDIDAFLSPTVPLQAPEIAPLLTSDDLFFATNARLLRNTAVVNLLDGCAFSIPCPGDAPVGLSLAAGRGKDDRLIAVAARIESILKGGDHARHQGT